MGKKRRAKQSAAEIPIEAGSHIDSPSPPHSPAPTFAADVSPSMATRLRRRVPQVPIPTNPQLRKRGQPKSSAASEPVSDNGIRDIVVFVPPIDVSPLKQSEQQPRRKRTRGAKFSELGSARTAKKVKRKGRSEEGTSTRVAAQAPSRRSKRRKVETTEHDETDAEEFDGESAEPESPHQDEVGRPPVFLSRAECQIRAAVEAGYERPEQYSFCRFFRSSLFCCSAIESTPQWASQLLTAITALGAHIKSLDEAVHRLNPPSDP